MRLEKWTEGELNDFYFYPIIINNSNYFRSLAGYRIRVSQARPRVRQSTNRRRFNTDMRCYQCGQRGHLSRECDDYSRKRRRYSRLILFYKIILKDYS